MAVGYAFGQLTGDERSELRALGSSNNSVTVIE
jgi:hypothetical protein